MHYNNSELALKTVDPKNRTALAKELKQPVRQDIVPISFKKLIGENDIFERLRFAYAINPIALQNRFAKMGIIVNSEEDLFPIAHLHATEMAKNGFTSPNGQFYAFDTEKILESVPLSKKAYVASRIKYVDAILDGDEVKILENNLL